MTLYKQFKTDKHLENEGIELEYGVASNGKPIVITIARAGGANSKFQKLMALKVKPYKRQIDNGTMDDETGERIAREVYAEAIVLDWQNVEFPILDNDGQPTDETEFLPYTPANCVRLFTDLPDLYADIREQASSASLFREHLLEEDVKN